MKKIGRNQWIKHLSEKFIEEEVMNLPESVILSIFSGAKKGLNIVFKSLHKALNSKLDDLAK